jgi:hypothetical protein
VVGNRILKVVGDVCGRLALLRKLSLQLLCQWLIEHIRRLHAHLGSRLAAPAFSKCTSRFSKRPLQDNLMCERVDETLERAPLGKVGLKVLGLRQDQDAESQMIQSQRQHS